MLSTYKFSCIGFLVSNSGTFCGCVLKLACLCQLSFLSFNFSLKNRLILLKCMDCFLSIISSVSSCCYQFVLSKFSTPPILWAWKGAEIRKHVHFSAQVYQRYLRQHFHGKFAPISTDDKKSQLDFGWSYMYKSVHCCDFLKHTLSVQNDGHRYNIFIQVYNVLWSYPPLTPSDSFLLVSLLSAIFQSKFCLWANYSICLSASCLFH